VNLHAWTLGTMLNAAEAAMDQAAADDTERQRNRVKLYAPPAGYRPGPGKRVRVPGMALDEVQARALAQQLAAEDAQLTGRGTG
jgi:hypothetical protein